jgi:hypothetical protein
MQHIITHTCKEHMARYLLRSHDVCHCDGTNNLQYDEVPPHAPHYVSLRVCQNLAIWRGTSSYPSSHENPTVSMVGDMARYLLIVHNTCHYYGADVGRYGEVPPHIPQHMPLLWRRCWAIWRGTSSCEGLACSLCVNMGRYLAMVPFSSLTTCGRWGGTSAYSLSAECCETCFGHTSCNMWCRTPSSNPVTMQEIGRQLLFIVHALD